MRRKVKNEDSRRGPHAPLGGNLIVNGGNLNIVVCICVLFLLISVLEAFNTFSRKHFQIEKICYFAVEKICHIHLNVHFLVYVYCTSP